MYNPNNIELSVRAFAFGLSMLDERFLNSILKQFRVRIELQDMYQRYSVSADKPQWLPVGEKNEFKAIIQDCYMGKAGTVVKEVWTPGNYEYPVVGQCVWHGARPGGPVWGDSPTFTHTVEVNMF